MAEGDFGLECLEITLQAPSLLPQGATARLSVVRENGRGIVTLDWTSVSGPWEAAKADL